MPYTFTAGTTADADEVNTNFKYMNALYECGSFAQIASGTNPQYLGSIVFGAGSLSNPCRININMRLTKPDADDILYITMSGPHVAYTGSTQVGNTITEPAIDLDIRCGSPYLSHIRGFYYSAGTNQTTINVTSNNISTNNFASGLTIYFTTVASAAFAVDNYVVTRYTSYN